MAEPVERIAKAGEPANQVRPGDSLERITRRDADGDRRRFVRRHVGQERPEEDAGHDAPRGVAVHQQRRESEPGGRPHQRDLLRRKRHRESEFRGDDVDGSCDGNRHHCGPWFHEKKVRASAHVWGAQ